MTLTQLYEAVRSDERKTDPFSTEEIYKQYDKVYEMFIDPIEGTDKRNDAQFELDMLTIMGEKQALKVGFKTAVSLIFSGMEIASIK